MTDKKNTPTPSAEEKPSPLCSGCWPLDELEDYIKKNEEKRQSEKAESD